MEYGSVEWAGDELEAHLMRAPLIAFLLTLMMSQSLTMFGKLTILLSFNIFSLPVIFLLDLSFPIWVWWIVIIFWLIFWLKVRSVLKKLKKSNEKDIDEQMSDISGGE